MLVISCCLLVAAPWTWHCPIAILQLSKSVLHRTVSNTFSARDQSFRARSMTIVAWYAAWYAAWFMPMKSPHTKSWTKKYVRQLWYNSWTSWRQRHEMLRRTMTRLRRLTCLDDELNNKDHDKNKEYKSKPQPWHAHHCSTKDLFNSFQFCLSELSANPCRCPSHRQSQQVDVVFWSQFSLMFTFQLVMIDHGRSQVVHRSGAHNKESHSKGSVPKNRKLCTLNANKQSLAAK